MSINIKVTKEQLDKLYEACRDQQEKGGSKYPGMTYEDGVIAVIEFLEGDTTEEEIYG